MTRDLPALGASLRATRLAAGLGLNEAARRIGVSGAYLCNTELGSMKMPAERLQQLAELYSRPDLLDKWCRLAGCVPPDVAEMLAEPGMFAWVRAANVAHRLGLEALADSRRRRGEGA